jgi:hypothetical protein
MRNCSRINNSPAAYAILCSSFKRDLTNFGAAICSSQKDCFVRLLQTDHHKKKKNTDEEDSAYSRKLIQLFVRWHKVYRKWVPG